MGLTRPKLAQISTTTSAFDDPIIVLNNNASSGISNDKDIGIVFERGGDTNQVLLWDESADQFVLASSNEQGGTSGDVTLIGYAPLQIGALKASSLILNSTLTFPTSDGSANQFLKTDGSGTLSWGTVTSSLTLAADLGTSDTFNTGETLTFAGGTGIDTTVSNNQISIAIDSATVATLTGSQTLTNKTIASPTITGTTTISNLSYPTTDGTNGQVLATNGAGTLSFVDVATTLDAVTDNGATTTNSIEVGGITVSGNIVPSANETYSLGTPTNRFSTLHVAESTVYLGDVALSIVSGELYVDGNPVAGAGDAWPGYNGDYDMAKGLDQGAAETPFQLGGEDPFGVPLALVFDNMEPSGQIITYDYADGEAYVGA